MNREIKFRAWDEKNLIMHYDFQFISSGNTENDWVIFTSVIQTLKTDFRNNPYVSPQLIKMQFTGLFDKNGNEIFEGDIVNASYEVCKEYGKTSQWGIVVFNSDMASFSVNTFDYIARIKGYRDHGYQTMDLFPLKDCLVMGNVYEYPELLEIHK